MSNRIRVTQALVNTRQKAEAILGEIATVTLERNRLRIEMDTQITEIRQRYESPLAGADKALEEKTAMLQSWAETNPEEFAGKKSIEMTHGKVGFRTGMPKLKTVMRKTWDAVRGTALALGRADLVRVKEEIDKERIISEFQAGNLLEGEMRTLGVQVVQDEAFFVEPRLLDLDNKIQEAA